MDIRAWRRFSCIMMCSHCIPSSLLLLSHSYLHGVYPYKFRSILSLLHSEAGVGSQVGGISSYGVLLPSNPGTSVEGTLKGSVNPFCPSSIFPSCHRYLCAGEVFLDWRSLLVPCSLFERSFSLHPIPIRRRARLRAQPIQIRLRSTTLLSVQPGLINR